MLRKMIKKHNTYNNKRTKFIRLKKLKFLIIKSIHNSEDKTITSNIYPFKTKYIFWYT